MPVADTHTRVTTRSRGLLPRRWHPPEAGQVTHGDAVLWHGPKCQGKRPSKGMVPSVSSHTVGLSGRWCCLGCRCCSSPCLVLGHGAQSGFGPRPLLHELQTSAWPLGVPDSNRSLTDDSSWEGFWFLSEAKLAQGNSWQLSAFVSTRQSGAQHLC